MKRGMVLGAALGCLAGGCATLGDGNYGVPVDAANRPQPPAASPPILVSASEASTYSTPYLGLVEVTFENNTPVWKEVEHVAVDFGSPAKNQSVTIPSGEDIDAWERAITIRIIRGGNIATTSIEAMGLNAGNALSAWASHLHHASTQPPPPSYPDQHLLSAPFRIPPGLFATRWILLSTSDNPAGGCIDSMILSYETSDHLTGRVRLPFKADSPWQNALCPHSPDVIPPFR
jgi:hypothetical protein